MYRKGSQGWIKHYDFVLFDLFALQFAYLIAYFIRNGAGNPYGIPLYRNMAVAIELADIAVLFFFETLKNVLKRGYYRELAVTVKHVVLVELIAVLYLFTIQAGRSSPDLCYISQEFLRDHHLPGAHFMENISAEKDAGRRQQIPADRNDERHCLYSDQEH